MNSDSILKKVPLFQCFSDADLEHFSLCLRVQRLMEKQALFRKGDEGTALYIIKKRRLSDLCQMV